MIRSFKPKRPDQLHRLFLQLLVIVHAALDLHVGNQRIAGCPFAVFLKGRNWLEAVDFLPFSARIAAF